MRNLRRKEEEEKNKRVITERVKLLKTLLNLKKNYVVWIIINYNHHDSPEN